MKPWISVRQRTDFSTQISYNALDIQIIASDRYATHLRKSARNPEISTENSVLASCYNSFDLGFDKIQK